MENGPYPSDLTGSEWSVIEPSIPGAGNLCRPPRYDKRRVLDAIPYLARSSIAWWMMPKELPPWRICYHYFSKWKREGGWQKIHDELCGYFRYRSDKQKLPRTRSSTRRACELLATPALADVMQERRLRESKDIYSWTRAWLRGPHGVSTGMRRGSNGSRQTRERVRVDTQGLGRGGTPR
ncbi:transposase [Pelagicoccus sp. SDUM812002]|uniref:transposase n=1 Tax=Pelagicoccus sp. SDUM812002 TaxID=3041266 RepID=UPI00281083A0|nr:transposase [Pelagicoccus sp. SDUM812002]MDQ8188615.1 transposase [Pelagicoccus sp. SDUM812002]